MRGATLLSLLTLLALILHAGVSALWLGAMAYSLFVVQPRLAAMLDRESEGGSERVEEAQRVLAHGNRWRVAGLIAVLWLSGIALVALRGEDTALWWAGVAGKAALLAAATALFWWVSWRGWPRRVFALPEELPALRRRFRGVAITMLLLVGTAFVLGVAL